MRWLPTHVLRNFIMQIGPNRTNFPTFTQIDEAEGDDALEDLDKSSLEHVVEADPIVNEADLSETKMANVASGKKILDAIASKLSPAAKSYWGNFFALQPSLNTRVMCGDADGSYARLLMTGIAAGVIHFGANGAEAEALLVDLLDLEQQMLSGSCVGLLDPSNTEKYEGLVKNLESKLEFRQGVQFGCIGDIAYDRLSGWLRPKLFDLIRNMKQNNDGVFIIGNHDMLQNELPFQQVGDYKIMWGMNKSCSPEKLNLGGEYQQAIRSTFTICHFDADRRQFFVHTGLKKELSPQGATYDAGILNNSEKFTVLATDGNMLAEAMNRAMLFPNFGIDTYFRPKDSETAQVAQELKMTVIKGHDGDSSQNACVVNINARAQKAFRPAVVTI